MPSVPAGLTGASCRADSGLTVALFTAVVWLGCSLVGWLGWAFPAPRPQLPTTEPPPLVMERVEVELGDSPASAPATSPGPVQGQATAASDLGSPPPLGALAPPPARPALAAVAPPSAALAAPLPSPGAPVADGAETSGGRAAAAGDTGGGRQGGTGPASTSGSSGQGSASGSGVHTLVFGVGEGLQPAAEYPAKALRERQEGAVLVRLRVSESGRVVSAQLTRPSAWPLLNAAALRVIRERWSFRPGPVRVYEVSIRFQLSNEG